MFCSIQNFEQLLFWQKFDFSSNFGSILQKDRKGGIGVATVIRWGSRAPLPPSAAANTTACARASTQLLTCLRHQATWMPKTCFPPPLSASVDSVALFAIPLRYSPFQSKRTPTTIPCEYTSLAPSPAKLSSPPSPPHPCEPNARPRALSSPLNRLDSLFFSNFGHPFRHDPFFVVGPSQEVPSRGNQC